MWVLSAHVLNLLPPGIYALNDLLLPQDFLFFCRHADIVVKIKIQLNMDLMMILPRVNRSYADQIVYY
jgi:hypothetical protein